MPVAVAATAVEFLLAGLLLSGWQRRWVGKVTAGLLVVYLLAMALSLGADAVASYALPGLIGGALLVTVVPARPPRGRREQEAGPTQISTFST